MRVLLLLVLGLAAVLAVPTPLDEEVEEYFSKPRQDNRIVGGSVTNIQTYPFGVAMLGSSTGANHRQMCGGTIINNRSYLTAAHCVHQWRNNNMWRCRVGSTNANSGGTVYNTAQIIRHPQYRPWPIEDNDAAIIRISGSFSWSNNVRAGTIAGPNYNPPDNAQVWAIGWGATSFQGPSSEQLRHVQVWTVNQNVCNQRYNGRITANMLCSGWLDVGGRDQCQGDSGGPLIHNNVIVGVCSWGNGCAHPRYPGVNARVSRFSNWAQQNA